MAITINHPFVSAKGDGSDATLVRPSNWNASHNLNMATSKVIGRLTAGPGLAEELPVTSYMMALLNTADYAALAVLLGLPTTGDAKLTYKIVADVGWVMANDGTIGDVGSGSTTASLTTQALFTHFYNTFSDAVCPLLTTAGSATTRAANGTATNAFAVNKCRIAIPKTLGRALIVGGAGAGLTSRALATTGGEENHVQTLAEIAPHTHTQQGTFGGSGTGSGSISGSGSGSCSGATAGSNQDINHLHNLGGLTNAADRSLAHTHPTQGATLGGTAYAGLQSGGSVIGVINSNAPTGNIIVGSAASPDHLHGLPATTGAMDRDLNGHTHNFSGSISVTSIGGSCSVTSVSVNTTISGQTASSGSGAGFNVMQPWTAWNIMIRL